MSGDRDGGRCATENREIDQPLCKQQNIRDFARVAFHALMLSRNADSRRKARCDSPEFYAEGRNRFFPVMRSGIGSPMIESSVGATSPNFPPSLSVPRRPLATSTNGTGLVV